MANNSFGIDLGTNNIKIFSKNDDSIMVEKNMIAIENKLPALTEYDFATSSNRGE